MYPNDISVWRNLILTNGKTIDQDGSEKTDNYEANAGEKEEADGLRGYKFERQGPAVFRSPRRRDAASLDTSMPRDSCWHVRGNNLSEIRSKWNNTRGALMIVGTRAPRITCSSCLRIMGNFQRKLRLTEGNVFSGILYHRVRILSLIYSFVSFFSLPALFYCFLPSFSGPFFQLFALIPGEVEEITRLQFECKFWGLWTK